MTRMNLSIVDPGEQIKPEGLPIDAASLYRAFEQVKDGRQARGKRYPLALLLTLIMVGKMAGEKTMSGIVDWRAERKHEMKAHLNWPKAFPVQSTYVEALARCSGLSR